MPAIPIYTASPINASKASGVTPQTAHSESGEPRTAPLDAAQSPNTYPAAQPGSRPSVPAPTGVPRAPYYPEPTPTTTAGSMSPAAPQPGAFPSLPAKSSLPPHPKAGEHLRNDQAQSTPIPMPPQMSYAPLGTSEMGVKRSSTTTATVPIPSPMADPLGGRLSGGNLSHPPGYQQNVHASDFSSNQRAAHQVAVEQDRSVSAVSIGDDDEGVWGTAKKWAAVAGEGLAAAENEVWKRINKD
ncbi:hypothetical protein B0T10DRAFT_476252 [Thelonectria olida]|uniref:Uncharacterized protein n=1 Tax=Thelonectria olida TaxID=1576542 RepID=A0A9P8WFA5_9HYPO|nr:hypothetical protein B0T10DRAFT_476252 [Thelonectria olida]